MLESLINRKPTKADEGKTVYWLFNSEISEHKIMLVLGNDYLEIDNGEEDTIPFDISEFKELYWQPPVIISESDYIRLKGDVTVLEQANYVVSEALKKAISERKQLEEALDEAKPIIEEAEKFITNLNATTQSFVHKKSSGSWLTKCKNWLSKYVEWQREGK